MRASGCSGSERLTACPIARRGARRGSRYTRWASALSLLLSALALGLVVACAPSAPSAPSGPPAGAASATSALPAATPSGAAPVSTSAASTATNPTPVPEPAATTSAGPTSQAAAGVPTPAAAPPTHILASYSERVGNYLPLILAQEQGIFSKHGLDVDLQLIPGATGMSALLSGQVQIAHVGGSEVVSAVTSGSDLVVSGNLGSVLPYVFIVTPEIRTVDDLKGKNVGISSVGGSADIATRLSMRHFGLDPDRDITILAMGTLQNRTAGLQNGAIQAAPANPPDSLLLQRQGFHVLFDIAELNFPAASATIVAQRGWVNEHPAAFQAWNDSIVEAIALAKRNPEVGIPAMKRFIQSEDDDLVRESYDYWINKVLKEPPAVTADQFADTLTALASGNPKVNDVDLARLIDPSYMQQAVDKGLAGTAP